MPDNIETPKNGFVLRQAKTHEDHWFADDDSMVKLTFQTGNPSLMADFVTYVKEAVRQYNESMGAQG